MTRRLLVRVPAGPQAPREARTRLASLADTLDPATFGDLMLLVSELVTNSYRHGRLRFGQQIEILVRAGPDTLRVEVSDQGRGFEAESRAASGATPKETGWGLFLVDQIADRWGIGDGGVTRVWFEMDLRRAAPTRPAMASGPR